MSCYKIIKGIEAEKRFNIHLKFNLDTDMASVITYLSYNIKLGMCSCFAAKVIEQSNIKEITLLLINLDYN